MMLGIRSNFNRNSSATKRMTAMCKWPFIRGVWELTFLTRSSQSYAQHSNRHSLYPRKNAQSQRVVMGWVVGYLVPELTQGFVCDQPDPNPKNISKADLTQTQKKKRLESKTRIWQPWPITTQKEIVLKVIKTKSTTSLAAEIQIWRRLSSSFFLWPLM